MFELSLRVLMAHTKATHSQADMDTYISDEAQEFTKAGRDQTACCHGQHILGLPATNVLAPCFRHKNKVLSVVCGRDAFLQHLIVRRRKLDDGGSEVERQMA